MRTAPTESSSRFRARAMTPWGNSSSSPAMTLSRPWMRAMPSPTDRTVPTSATSTPVREAPELLTNDLGDLCGANLHPRSSRAVSRPRCEAFLQGAEGAPAPFRRSSGHPRGPGHRPAPPDRGASPSPLPCRWPFRARPRESASDPRRETPPTRPRRRRRADARSRATRTRCRWPPAPRGGRSRRAGSSSLRKRADALSSAQTARTTSFLRSGGSAGFARTLRKLVLLRQKPHGAVQLRPNRLGVSLLQGDVQEGSGVVPRDRRGDCLHRLGRFSRAPSGPDGRLGGANGAAD